MNNEPEESKFRVTKITVRCNRAIAPFQHVRAEVEVAILKGGDKEEASKYAIKLCHETISRMAAKEKAPKIIFDELDDNLPDLLENKPEPEPF